MAVESVSSGSSPSVQNNPEPEKKVEAQNEAAPKSETGALQALPEVAGDSFQPAKDFMKLSGEGSRTAVGVDTAAGAIGATFKVFGGGLVAAGGGQGALRANSLEAASDAGDAGVPVGATASGTPSKPGDQVTITPYDIYGNPAGDGGPKTLYVSGVNASGSDAVDQGKSLATALGREMTLTYNGQSVEWGQAVLSALPLPAGVKRDMLSPEAPTRAVEASVLEQLHAGKPVDLVALSGGAAITCTALKNVHEQLAKENFLASFPPAPEHPQPGENPWVDSQASADAYKKAEEQMQSVRVLTLGGAVDKGEWPPGVNLVQVARKGDQVVDVLNHGIYTDDGKGSSLGQHTYVGCQDVDDVITKWKAGEYSSGQVITLERL